MHPAGEPPYGYFPANADQPGQFPPPGSTQPFPAGGYSTGYFPPGQPQWQPRRRRRAWLVPLAVLVVLSLLLTGVYTVVTKLSGGGRQPESLVPADALAFAKVDLDPGLGQKVAAYRLAKKLPGQQGKSDHDVRSYLLGKLFSEPDLNYARDIQPWLGDRVAIAALPAAGSDDPRPLGVLQVKDEAKARAFLDARESRGDQLGFRFRDGYVLLGENQAVADQASRDASDHSLQDAGRFREDLQHLHGGKIATAWVDLPAVLRAAQAADPDQFSSLSEVKDFQGRLVAGISAASDAVELEARVVGTQQLPKGQDVLGRLEALPASSPVGVALSTSSVTSDPDASRALDQALDDASDELDSDYGVKPADVRNLFGGTAVFGLADVPGDDEDPKLAVLVDGIADPARAARTVQAFLDGDSSGNDSYGSDSDRSGYGDSDSSSDPKAQVQQTGSGVVVSTDPGYAQTVAQHSGAQLGDDELFRKAIADPPKHTLGAGYVSVQPFLNAPDAKDVPAEARVVQAVGVTLGTENDELVLHARVIID